MICGANFPSIFMQKRNPPVLVAGHYYWFNNKYCFCKGACLLFFRSSVVLSVYQQHIVLVGQRIQLIDHRGIW